MRTSILNIDRIGRTRRLTLLLVSVVALGALTGCATFNAPRPEPVTVPQIIAMVKEGLPADDIIAKF